MSAEIEEADIPGRRTQLVVARPLEGVAPLYYCGVMAET